MVGSRKTRSGSALQRQEVAATRLHQHIESTDKGKRDTKLNILRLIETSQ